jgi:glycosyltransferase involved in cell wall biosynthesis
MRSCQALIWPGDEDLGLTPLEVLASGRPVVAYRAGGAMETLVDGVTGTFFERQTPEALVAALRAFDPEAYEPTALRAHVCAFDVSVFQQRLRRFVEASVHRQRDRAVDAVAPGPVATLQ